MATLPFIRCLFDTSIRIEDGCDIPGVFGLLAEPKVHEFIKNESLWSMDIHLSKGMAMINLLPPLKCTLSKLIPFPHRIQIRFEAAIHMHGIDRVFTFYFNQRQLRKHQFPNYSFHITDLVASPI